MDEVTQARIEGAQAALDAIRTIVGSSRELEGIFMRLQDVYRAPAYQAEAIVREAFSEVYPCDCSCACRNSVARKGDYCLDCQERWINEFDNWHRS